MSDSKDIFDKGFPRGDEDPFNSGPLDLGSADGDFDPFSTPDPVAETAVSPAENEPDGADTNAGWDTPPVVDDEFEEPEAPPSTTDVDSDDKPQTTRSSGKKVPQKTTTKPESAPDRTEDDQDPLSSAVQEVTTKSLMTQLPIFDNGVREEIENPDQTFEELRQAKALHFSELQDAARVSWTVAYGAVTKPIYKPKEQKISDVKREIERSKEFLKGLAKNRSPECYVRPKVTAQKKGKLPSYMGVYRSLEEARASDKVITLFPGGDGLVHERRNMEMGEFITHAGPQQELSWVEAGFRPALPLIPGSLLEGILAFFRAVMYRDKSCSEALVNIYWDRKDHQFCIDVPPQRVSHDTVDTDLGHIPDPERYLHYMDVHSHNTMKAYFSKDDDADEQATRLYAVLGCLDHYYPDFAVRLSNNGKFHLLDPCLVFERSEGSFQPEWLGRVVPLQKEKAAA